MPTQYVEGEEERLALADPMVERAFVELARMTRAPVPEQARDLLRWIAREAFRLGYSHAHERSTVKDDLWPNDEVTK